MKQNSYPTLNKEVFSVKTDPNGIAKVQANIKKDPEMLNQALDQVREMRDLWKEIMKQNHMYVR